MLKATVEKYTLEFKRPSGTSRGVLTTKDSWFIKIWNENEPTVIGTGEASIIKTLSPDWNDNYESLIQDVAANINEYVAEGIEKLVHSPSIYFAVEMAMLDLLHGGKEIYYESDFTNNQAPIKINGLIWMGEKEFMLAQIQEKIAAGFDCIKLKIGAIDFESELALLHYIRSKHPAKASGGAYRMNSNSAGKNAIELRVDANGAFTPENALEKLVALADFDLHSIEQPIKQGQFEAMHDLCYETPLPIALDEELIGVTAVADKKALLKKIKPQYIILKPSLIGGFKGTDEWIKLAEELGIAWWITSALESNIGLNAIAQYTFTKNNPLPQGLGTGQLYTNNTPSGLTIINGTLILK